MTYQTMTSSVAFCRRAFLVAGASIGLMAMVFGLTASAQSAGSVKITIDENLASVHGMAEIVINQEPQGVLSAGCCKYLQVGRGTHDLTLRWPDLEVSTTFESDGAETIAFHLTAEHKLILLED